MRNVARALLLSGILAWLAAGATGSRAAAGSCPSATVAAALADGCAAEGLATVRAPSWPAALANDTQRHGKSGASGSSLIAAVARRAEFAAVAAAVPDCATAPAPRAFARTYDATAPPALT